MNTVAETHSWDPEIQSLVAEEDTPPAGDHAQFGDV